ncbi:Brix-domain-containing protein [Jaminaea rosea]|uniref:Ribosome production factor 2 homolog n=1 Tax=Jaminaea rosea TaxID=1569628 RepID=A0A316UT16_9BASI|nr:Brix-domain-containing protein [Jaminaea rosea]PWN28412.1 Brix-domain-containing protein [Jaminaea rosea]
MLSIKKPRNARSKRALEKRQPATNEPVKTALFVNASHSSHTVSQALQQLSALKKPYAISFSKKKSNDVNPFVDASSIEFWCAKNDTPLMLVGDSRKKRKDNLTWIRLFDGKVLDMLEMGIDSLKTTEEFKPPTLPDLGTRPLFHFAGQQFATEAAGEYPAHAHLKSLMLDFYRGEEVLENGIPTGGKVALQGGLQMVISVTATSDNEGTSKGNGAAGATLADLYAAGQATSSNGAPSSSATPIDTSASGSRIGFRVYTITVPPKTPARAIPSNFTLNECGPSLDLTIRRRQPADATMLHQSLKRAKTQAEKNRQGKSDTYKKNIDTDEMGDMVGRVHVGKQDLSKLQTRKMKGLKADKNGAEESDDEDDEEEHDDDDEDEDEFMALGSGDEDEMEDDEDDDEEDAAEMADLVGDSEDDDDEPAPAPKGAMSSKKRGRKA